MQDAILILLPFNTKPTSTLPPHHWQRTQEALTDRVSKHCPQVRCKRQHSQTIEQHPVDHGVPHALGRQQHDEGDHKVSVEHKEPCDEGTDHAAAILDEPELRGVRRDAHWAAPNYGRLPLQQGPLLLLVHLTEPVGLHHDLTRSREEGGKGTHQRLDSIPTTTERRIEREDKAKTHRHKFYIWTD